MAPHYDVEIQLEPTIIATVTPDPVITAPCASYNTITSGGIQPTVLYTEFGVGPVIYGEFEADGVTWTAATQIKINALVALGIPLSSIFVATLSTQE